MAERSLSLNPPLKKWPWLRLMPSTASIRSITHAATQVRNQAELPERRLSSPEATLFSEDGGRMSYIKHVLQPGETVRYQGSVHWILYFPAILLVATGIIILIMTWGAPHRMAYC